MAAADQPLKKRKLYDAPPPSSPQPPPPPTPPTPPPLSQDEIIRRRRCQEEIRNVFECYKRIKFLIDQKEKPFTTELEEAYLSLITAAGGRTIGGGHEGGGLYYLDIFTLIDPHALSTTISRQQ